MHQTHTSAPPLHVGVGGRGVPGSSLARGGKGPRARYHNHYPVGEGPHALTLVPRLSAARHARGGAARSVAARIARRKAALQRARLARVVHPRVRASQRGGVQGGLPPRGHVPAVAREALPPCLRGGAAGRGQGAAGGGSSSSRGGGKGPPLGALLRALRMQRAAMGRLTLVTQRSCTAGAGGAQLRCAEGAGGGSKR